MPLFDRLFGRRGGLTPPIPPEQALDRAMGELQAKQAIAARLWGFGEDDARWHVDLTEGVFSFTRANGMEVRAPVQVVGTYNTGDGTFLWGWDHPSVPEPCRDAARAVLAWGKANKRADMTTAKVACTEEDAWTYAALALHLTGAQGAYRGSSGPTLVFMVFGTVTLSGGSAASVSPGTGPDSTDWGRGLTLAECPEAVALVRAYGTEMFRLDKEYDGARQRGDQQFPAFERCIAAKRAAYDHMWRAGDEYWVPISSGWPSDHDPERQSNWRTYLLGPDTWRVCFDVADANLVRQEAYDVRRFPDGLRIVDRAIDDPDR